MTTTRASRAVAVPPWGLAMAAMLSVQLGSALSMELISAVGPAATAWLRLSAGALIFLALARPPLRSIRRRDVPTLLALGVATGVMAIAFLAAIERIPLGTAVAVEFLGPLTVAAVRSHNTRALIWPAMALLGVVLLTQPWHGDINVAGIGFAALAAIGWAAYILLTQRVGDRFAGIGGLTLTIPVAAVTAARRRHPTGQRPPHSRHHRCRGRAGATVPRPAVRVGDARTASHDAHRVRDPDGPGTGPRRSSRAARTAPETLDHPSRRHPARRARRRRRPTRRTTPPAGHRTHRRPPRKRRHLNRRQRPAPVPTAVAPRRLDTASESHIQKRTHQ